MFTTVYSCLSTFTLVYVCLTLFTHVNLYLLVLDNICDWAREKVPLGAKSDFPFMVYSHCKGYAGHYGESLNDMRPTVA